MDEDDTSGSTLTILELPDEILEFIFTLVSPYGDLDNCQCVCKRWKALIQGMSITLHQEFVKAVKEYRALWEHYPTEEYNPTLITKRYSHSAVYYKNSMYVFGGCTSVSTTFNDLWRLDLTRREWQRPLATGTYPSPKASASLVVYKESLYLFGGWTHPAPYLLYQTWKLFDQLHEYNINSNQWNLIVTPDGPPPSASHSATIHHSTMVVFGGLQHPREQPGSLNGDDQPAGPGMYSCSNDIWCFDILTRHWWKQHTCEPKPKPRYGQSQLKLDDEHVIIIGGCGGPNSMLSDMWLLEMKGPVWLWTQLTIMKPDLGPSQLFCHPACLIGDFAVILGKSPRSTTPIVQYSSRQPRTGVRIVSGEPNRPDDQRDSRMVAGPSSSSSHQGSDINVNGRKGHLRRRHPPVPSESSSDDSEGDWNSSSGHNLAGVSDGDEMQLQGGSKPWRYTVHPSIKPNTMRNRERRLPVLGSCDRTQFQSEGVPARNTVHSSVNLNEPQKDEIRLHVVGDLDRQLPVAGNGERKLPFAGTSDRQLPVVGDINRQLPVAGDGDRQLPVAGDGDRQLPVVGDSDRMQFHNEGIPARNTAHPSIKPNAMRNRERQLEILRRMEIRIRNLTRAGQSSYNVQYSPPAVTSKPTRRGSPMIMHCLDLTNVLVNHSVSWTPHSQMSDACGPEETMLYSLVLGKSELVMFGGLQKDLSSVLHHDASSQQWDSVTNSLHFLQAPKLVV